MLNLDLESVRLGDMPEGERNTEILKRFQELIRKRKEAAKAEKELKSTGSKLKEFFSDLADDPSEVRNQNGQSAYFVDYDLPNLSKGYVSKQELQDLIPKIVEYNELQMEIWSLETLLSRLGFGGLIT